MTGLPISRTSQSCFRPHGRGARLAREQRHFAEAIARAQDADPNGRAVFRDRNLRRAAQKNEHGIAFSPFFDDAFAAAEMIEFAIVQTESIELLLVETLEERFASQNSARLLALFRMVSLRRRSTCSVRIGKGMVMR